MTQLVSIDSVPPSANLIERIEKLLDEARKGDISAVSFAIVHRDGCTSNGWSELASLPAMLGSVVMLQADLLNTRED